MSTLSIPSLLAIIGDLQGFKLNPHKFIAIQMHLTTTTHNFTLKICLLRKVDICRRWPQKKRNTLQSNVT